ncbi:MAG: hypothetical protein HQL45_01920 [Alphaproteobacteria bacterium]|nr:hypothetical protein [Alphaproteobacteria bacterium]
MAVLVRAFQNVLAWLTLADYDSAKERATVDIVARLARRNVSFQNGSILNGAALRKLSEEGDAAMAHLRKLASHN